jgi:hypothetical protein
MRFLSYLICCTFPKVMVEASVSYLSTSSSTCYEPQFVKRFVGSGNSAFKISAKIYISYSWNLLV